MCSYSGSVAGREVGACASPIALQISEEIGVNGNLLDDPALNGYTELVFLEQVA
jgi:hypothetical protein